jgi:tRNA pseudouridine55 synthase
MSGREGRRRRKGDRVDGVLLLDKPAGLTSNQALQRVKRLLNARKAGHTGALDPAATGMLPLCFGEATKVSAYLLGADKTYRVTVRLGVATDSGDRDGKETGRAEVPEKTAAAWQAVLQSFVGESMQVPPMYSALKQDGKRLYELARKGQIVEREPRKIRIDWIELLESAGNRLVFRVRCSKGTYIRSLVEDIAKAAGTVAYTAALHREVVGDFQEADMLDLETIEEIAAAAPNALRERLLPADAALSGLQACCLTVEQGRQFSAGQPVATPGSDPRGLVRVYAKPAGFLGVGERDAQGVLAPRRVFSTPEKNA